MASNRRTNPKRDFTQVAFEVFQQATGDAERPKPLAGRKVNSSKGGKIGAHVRAENLSQDERSKIASKAAKARWNRKQTQ